MKNNNLIHKPFCILLKSFYILHYTFYIPLLTACADLDLPSDGRLTLNDVFGNYRSTKNYYNSCRTYMPAVGFSEPRERTPLASFCDEAHDANDGVNGPINRWYNNTASSYNNPLSDVWAAYFQGIRKCNVFLQCINDPEIATAPVNSDEKNGWTGEILVMRAFYYWQLVKRYGGVPIISAPYGVNHDFTQDRRATFEECVDFILGDCDAALALPESGKATIGFRWYNGPGEGGLITRAFAHALKSQAALYAASSLWFTPESKYTWQKAAQITKEALDQCLEHGFELFELKPDAGIAQNAYAYYFFYPSDPGRAVDKETIYESTGGAVNVWKWAGTPIQPGAEKAGAGPSQELVDAYNMQTSGEMPITGYSDPQHLQPIVNPAASDYDPANPYTGRDPRFYASIYYNNSPRSLITEERTITTIPLRFIEDDSHGVKMEENGDEVKLTITGSDPYIYTDTIGARFPESGTRKITFEYKSSRAISNAEFFFCVNVDGIDPLANTGKTLVLEASTSEWKTFEYYYTFRPEKFSVGNEFGLEPEQHFLRFDPIETVYRAELILRNFRLESEVKNVVLPVETFIGGNCGISENPTETRYTRTGYYMRKFNNHKSNVDFDGDGRMKIFRLGELYLNFAEAAFQAAGPDAVFPAATPGGRALSAREAVNIVRARAEMPPLPQGLSNAAFETRYRNERRVELAFEEHRFFDVRRWKILSETDGFVTGMKITDNGVGNYLYTRIKLQDRGTNTDKYLMYPVNLSEVIKMKDYTGESWQNPGWN
jgi:hypothetical protein